GLPGRLEHGSRRHSLDALDRDEPDERRKSVPGQCSEQRSGEEGRPAQQTRNEETAPVPFDGADLPGAPALQRAQPAKVTGIQAGYEHVAGWTLDLPQADAAPHTPVDELFEPTALYLHRHLAGPGPGKPWCPHPRAPPAGKSMCMMFPSMTISSWNMLPMRRRVPVTTISPSRLRTRIRREVYSTTPR